MLIFLDLVAQHFRDSILILQLDNGAFHKAKRLRVPDNIILFFQPSYSPELNPIEQVWQYLKRQHRKVVTSKSGAITFSTLSRTWEINPIYHCINCWAQVYT